jgi:ABC-type nitrate/sulfonate/bicarbonate transport system substrate-binding protein
MPKREIWHSSRYPRAMSAKRPHSRPNHPPIRLGYVSLADCAPIAVAQETGLFTRHGLDVRLSRELGWASVRDKIYQGELDATQAIAGIAFSLGLGITEPRREVAVPMVLNLHGNAITLAKELDAGLIGRPGGLKQHLQRNWRRDRPFTLAATHRFSSHFILLQQWLRRQDLAEPGQVEMVFLPPPLMAQHLKAGHIDGYCVGEPWNSEAVLSGIGWCPATSADLSHGHPEKVLLVSDQFVLEQKETTIRLVAALLDACRLCQDPMFRDELISILALRQYTGTSKEVLLNSLGSEFQSGNGTVPAEHFHIFHGQGVNAPTVEKASWVLSGLRAAGALPDVTGLSLSRIYREDLFHAAVAAGAA